MEQRLIQSPQMIQAMQILQLAGADLEERIEHELVENPFLEQVEGDGQSAADPAPTPEGESERLNRTIDDLDQAWREIAGRDTGGRPSRAVASAAGEDEDLKLAAMNNTPARYQSLGEALADQVGLFDLAPRDRALAEYLAYSFDAKGFLPEGVEEAARACPLPGCSAEELQAVLAVLREQVHPALGARDLRECLLLQLEAHGEDEPLVRALVEHHLEDLTTNRLPRIAKATGATIEEIKHALEALRGLDPCPGREFGEERAAAITPDVLVDEQEGAYVVRLTRQRFPSLRLSGGYKELLKQGGNDPAVQQWIKKRVEAARWFLDALAQRESTLERIAKVIFERQRDFLDKGARALRPLRMQEVADATHVHISTVSRAVSGKYAQTPQGILPLKFFFTGGTTNDSGEVESQTSIKARIRDLVGKEDRDHPLSDDQIAELLEKEQGVRIARRTVTKYRKALDIPSSAQRRSY
jgi:RNA polymerase sigma-54 factor